MYSLHFHHSGTGKVASAPCQQDVILNVVQRIGKKTCESHFQPSRMEPRVSSQSVFQRAADAASVFMNKW